MVGRGAFRFGRSSPPRFPAHTEGVGSRLRCLAESCETTAEGPPGSDGRRWTAAVATREGWDGICPKISISALDWREGGAGRVSHRSLLRCCRRTCCGGRPARGPSPRDEPGSRARCVRTSCLGAVCDGTMSHQAVDYRCDHTVHRIRRQITSVREEGELLRNANLFARNRGLGRARGTSNSARGTS